MWGRQTKSRLLPAVVSLLAAGAFTLIACNRQGVGDNPPALAPTTQKTPTATRPTTAPTTQKAFKPIATDHLHNAHVVVDGKILSGAQPDDEESFKTLQSLGVKTILSVDGAAPDVDLAHKYGMRYVHIPIGYDGVSKDEGEKIAKALVEFSPSGPMYVHCHHGKHRSAAAVAVSCVYSGLLAPEQAESVLQTFGTGANYTGLWKAARDARPLAPGTLQGMKVDFVERAKISDAAAHMVKIDEHFDHLKQVKSAGWKAPANHPDLSPAHEALQLQEHFRESSRLPDFSARPDDYQKRLNDSERSAELLHRALASSPSDHAGAEAAFKLLSASCVSCHKAHRD